MQKKRVLLAGALGGLSTILLIALGYLGDQLAGLPFAPYDLFDWLTRHLPGTLINAVIDTMVKTISALKLGPTAATAKVIEQGIGLTQFVAGGVIIGVILVAIGGRKPERLIPWGGAIGAVLGIGMVLIETTLRFPAAGPVASSAWLLLTFIGWGALLGRLIADLAFYPLPAGQAGPGAGLEDRLSRRQFLYITGISALAVLAGAARLRYLRQARGLANGPSSSAATPAGNGLPNTGDGAQSGPAGRIEAAPGTRAELTPNEQFYRIDINADPPKVDGGPWRLQLDGLVEKPLSLTLADLRTRRAVTQAITLSCISNEVGGDLISSSNWTGVPFKDLLAEAGLKPGVQEIAISAVDGFYESVPLQEAMDDRTLLVYAMNDQPLPVEHGFPLRIYIPGHYGMKQPKWITHLQAIDHQGAGYWVERGWSRTAIVQATAVIDHVAVNQPDAQGNIPVGGIAYAGARGISRVELQVDNGPWEAAVLRLPPLSALTWVQWRYDWKATPGRHTLQVRATDGAGKLQVVEDHSTFPDGATGIHSMSVDVPS